MGSTFASSAFTHAWADMKDVVHSEQSLNLDGERRRKERVRKREGKAEEEESKISMLSLKEGMEISIFRGSDKL
jgi:hypothetical protein